MAINVAINFSFCKVLTDSVGTNRGPVRNTDKYILNSAPECVVLPNMGPFRVDVSYNKISSPVVSDVSRCIFCYVTCMAPTYITCHGLIK